MDLDRLKSSTSGDREQENHHEGIFNCQGISLAEVKFVGVVQGVVSEAKAEGLWFLKHSTMDRNEGVMCFKGAWTKIRHPWFRDVGFSLDGHSNSNETSCFFRVSSTKQLAEASEICWRTGTNCPKAREVSTSLRRGNWLVDGEATMNWV